MGRERERKKNKWLSGGQSIDRLCEKRNRYGE